VKASIQQRLRKTKRRIERRLRRGSGASGGKPMFAASSIRYELAEKTQAIGVGGIGLVHRLEDIELRRNDEVFLDALGTERIPDPTTAGDFCRRFYEGSIRALLEAADDARLKVWARQPKQFFQRATIDLDGTLVVTSGACKEGFVPSTQGHDAEERSQRGPPLVRADLDRAGHLRPATPLRLRVHPSVGHGLLHRSTFALPTPHAPVNGYNSGNRWPKGGKSPANYPAIHAVADGAISRVDYRFGLRGGNDRYGVDLAFAVDAKGNKNHLCYSIEPMIPEPSEGFYRKFITVSKGQKVRKGNVLAYMYCPPGVKDVRIHFHVTVEGRNGFLAPAIFGPDVVRQFHAN